MKLRLVSTALAVAALLTLLPAAGAEGSSSPPAWYRCRDKRERVYPLTLSVEGQPASGRVSFPRGFPKGLLVFAHGYGHTSMSWVEHMKEAARRGFLAVTMDYRGLQILPDDNGDGLPSSRGWNAMTGAEDLIAAAQMFESMCAIETVTILGVSMGGDMSGLAVAKVGERQLLKSDGETPLFDYWVDVEGATNLTETYTEARLVAPANTTAKNAQADIEAETGGTFEQRPEEYRRRTVVARVDDLEASGVRGVIVIHGLDDGLVPYNQSRELTALMRDAGIETEMITIGRRDEDSERETTLTGAAAGAIYKDYTSPLSGHASEKSSTHIVMQTALSRLWTLMRENPPLNRECLVNGQTPPPVSPACSG